MLTIGIDVGGTFTDLVVIDEVSGEIATTKTLSTPSNQADGVLTALRKLEVDLSSVRRIVHGMTVATNAVLERRGAKVAVITTEGFRDVLEIGRTQRMTFTMFDPYFVRPQPLAARPLRFEVRERVAADGRVVKPLCRQNVLEICARAKAAGAEAFAICFLNSYKNPEHERAAAAILNEVFDEPTVSVSSEIVPEYREYERFTTTVTNAFVQPVMSRYLQSFESRLRDAGYGGPIYIMASNGGSMDVGTAARRPVNTLFSGPAGGVVGSIQAAEGTRYGDLISYDMGGTSTDVCLIQDRTPSFSSQSLVTGIPIKVPQLNINTVGAGGGSIAWAEGGSALRVGPRSAGSVPGPACYGKGGTEPTVTDANLFLGRIGASSLLDGEMDLDTAAAERAIRDLTAELGMIDPYEVAEGIIALAVVHMANAIREISLQKGHDPRDFALVALGGAGPMHAAETAAEIGMRSVIVPQFPGTLSALGLLSSELRNDYVASYRATLDDVDWRAVGQTFETLFLRGRDHFEATGLGRETISGVRSLDLRYAGQAFELTIPFADPELDTQTVQERFASEYSRQYGHVQGQSAIEIVALRMAVKAAITRPNVGVSQSRGGVESRMWDVYFAGTMRKTPVLHRGSLPEGFELQGPAIIEEFGSTTIVPPSWNVSVQANGNLLMAYGR